MGWIYNFGITCRDVLHLHNNFESQLMDGCRPHSYLSLAGENQGVSYKEITWASDISSYLLDIFAPLWLPCSISSASKASSSFLIGHSF